MVSAAGWVRPHRSPRMLALVIVIAAYMTGGWWQTERDSCMRNSDLRAAYNRTISTQVALLATARARARIIVKTQHGAVRASTVDAIKSYGQLIANQRTVKTLDCSGLLPDK